MTMTKLTRAAILVTLHLALCGHARAGWGVAWSFAGWSGIVTNGSAYNNVPAPSGAQAAFVQNTGAFEQSFAVTTAGRYTVAWKGSVRYWPDTHHDYDVMVDGARLLRIDSATLSPWTYRPLSLAVDLAAGDHTLRFEGVNSRGGEHTSFIDDVTVRTDAAGIPLKNAAFDEIPYTAGSFVLRPPAVTTPLVRLEGKVATSGRAIFGRLVSIVDGKYVPIVDMPIPPAIRVNSRVAGAVKTLVSSPDHDGFMLLFADGIRVNPGDTCTLSAPLAWATVANDFAAAMDHSAVEVCTDRSFVGTAEGPRSFAVGLNTGHLFNPTWGTYAATKNLRVRMLRWDSGVVGADRFGYPTKLSKDFVSGAVVEDNNSNGIDGTGTPTPEGLYAVGWGRNGTGQAECSLSSGDALVTERTDLANPGDGHGGGMVRVFDFRRRPGAARANFGVWLGLTDRSRTPSLKYVVVNGPGDFKAKDNTPTVLEGIDDPAAPSAAWLERTASGVGSLRFCDGFLDFDNASDACEPEHIQDERQWSWNGWVKAWTIRYLTARPWTRDSSPYAYSPLFGEPYVATLGTTLDAPTAGTRQVVDVPDAATAPVIEGLVLQAGDERMRVLSVDGTRVTIERGSESTMPSVFAAGPVAVSGRLPLTSLAVFAARNAQVAEIITDGPHRLRTGNHPTYDGEGWAAWPCADGSKFNAGHGLRFYTLNILVTAPDRFVVVTDGAIAAGNTTLSADVTLDPNLCTSLVVVPGDAGPPHSVAARVAAGRGADFHINIPFAASDSYVDSVAAITLANFPPGHRVYLEYINEPWNWGYTTSKSQARLCWMLGQQGEGSMLWQIRRTGQIRRRFAAAFAARGRGAEVRSLLNMQLGTAGNIRSVVGQSLAEGFSPPDIAIAPYTGFGGKPSLFKALNTAGLDQAVDLWIWNLVYGRVPATTSTTPWCVAARAAVDAVNKELGTSIELYGYEGGVGESWPVEVATLAADAAADSGTLRVADASIYSVGQLLRVGPEWVRVGGIAGNVLTVDRGQAGTTAGAYKAGTQVRNSYLESSHDLTYHPNFRQAELDQFGLWEKSFHRMCLNGHSMHWQSGYFQWCQYHWMGQARGRGDGKDGLADNRQCLATPGLPGSKGPGVNQDLKNVSVRGQAFAEWNRWARP